MTKAPAMAPAIPRSILRILRIRLPIAMIGIPTNTQPTAKNGRLQKKNRKLTLGSRKRNPDAIPDTNQQMPIASIEFAMRIGRVGVSIGSRKELRAMAPHLELPVYVHPAALSDPMRSELTAKKIVLFYPYLI
jgi:hypothetical protein